MLYDVENMCCMFYEMDVLEIFFSKGSNAVNNYSLFLSNPVTRRRKFTIFYVFGVWYYMCISSKKSRQLEAGENPSSEKAAKIIHKNLLEFTVGSRMIPRRLENAES